MLWIDDTTLMSQLLPILRIFGAHLRKSCAVLSYRNSYEYSCVLARPLQLLCQIGGIITNTESKPKPPNTSPLRLLSGSLVLKPEIQN